MNNRMCGREQELFIRSSLIDLLPYSQWKLRILIPGIFRTFFKQSPKPHCWGCWGKLKRLSGHLKLKLHCHLTDLLAGIQRTAPKPPIPAVFLRSYRRTAPGLQLELEERRRRQGVSGSVNHQGTFFPTPSPPASRGMLLQWLFRF